MILVIDFFEESQSNQDLFLMEHPIFFICPIHIALILSDNQRMYHFWPLSVIFTQDSFLYFFRVPKFFITFHFILVLDTLLLDFYQDFDRSGPYKMFLKTNSVYFDWASNSKFDTYNLCHF